METCFYQLPNYCVCTVCVRFKNLIIALNRLFGSDFKFILLFCICVVYSAIAIMEFIELNVCLALVFWLQVVHTHLFPRSNLGSMPAHPVLFSRSRFFHVRNLIKWLDIMDRRSEFAKCEKKKKYYIGSECERARLYWGHP